MGEEGGERVIVTFPPPPPLEGSCVTSSHDRGLVKFIINEEGGESYRKGITRPTRVGDVASSTLISIRRPCWHLDDFTQVSTY